MALGWNEIKERAVKFSKEWENAFNEEADGLIEKSQIETSSDPEGIRHK
jgi:hypothetical protein